MSTNSTRRVCPGVRRRGETYEFRVSMGSDMDGKPIIKYHSFVPPLGISESKADKMAMEEYATFSRKVKGNIAYADAMRFSELCDRYFEEYAPRRLKAVTAEQYKSTIKNHILPVFGNQKLKNITTASVTTFLGSFPHLKPLTVTKIKILLHSILSFAVSQKIIDQNPCVGAIWRENITRDYGKIENVLTLTQAKQVLCLMSEYSQFHTIIKVLLLTGMRSGECLALRWSSVDFQRGTIFIDKTLSYANKTTFLSTPKTERSTRTIAIDHVVMNILKQHQEEQNKQKAIAGTAWLRPEMVFTNYTGDFINKSTLNTQFRKFIAKHRDDLGLNHNLTVHGLRHTNASLLLYAGEDIQNISAHLGHASSEVTSIVYSHMYAEVRVRLARTVSSALLGDG